MAQEKSQSLRPGTKLKSKDRVYEILEVLGSGTFGITYKAHAQVPVGNIIMDIKFAIKEHFVSASCYRADDGATVLTVPQAKGDVTESRSDFLTEAKRLQRLCLKSRNIVSVNETFEANGTAYYVMEYLDGGSPYKCKEDEAISIVKQIANALDEIHNEKVLHLDVKPDNIVLKKNDMGETYPVLIDFGISKHFDSKGRPTTKVNAKGASPGYAPQEQYADISEFSPKYDIYALGAVLYYLATGKNPPDAFKISPNQQELKKELAGKVSSNVEKAILNAMTPSAMERTSSIRQFCDDLMGVDFIPVLNVSESTVSFEKEKGQMSLRVDSNISWSVYSEGDWCKVKKKDNDVILSVDKNKETGDRSCNVIVNGLTYQLSQTIEVVQKGIGTIVITPKPKWWELHRKEVYQAGCVVLIGGIIIGLYFMFKPNPIQESKLLTEAIASMNGPELKKYAELESIRAYLPYAKFLFAQEDFENAQFYANKAISTLDSLPAATLLSQIQTDLESRQPAELISDNVIETTSEVENEIIPAQEDSRSQALTKEETNDEKFARATNDFNLMMTLAKDNYAKAYYPLAVMYYNKKDNKNAKVWANKAISARSNSSKAQILLDQIDSKQPTQDELFASATKLADFKSLADKGYEKAYVPLAELYLKNKDYDNAHKWAVKAGNSKIDLTRARQLINVLTSYGYYDNGEHGGVPIF